MGPGKRKNILKNKSGDYDREELRNTLHGNLAVYLKALTIFIKYVNFWVIPRRQVYIDRRFRTLCQVHLQSL
jgi:hypothetical protein